MLRWTVESNETGEVVIVFSGEITGHIDFNDLLARRQKVVLDLGGVRRINSMGVDQFMRFLQSLDSEVPIEVENCSVTLVMQLNMLPVLAELLNVRSFFVPFECPKCLEETEHLLEVKVPGRRPALPVLSCVNCGASLEMSDLEERYFAFLGM